MVNSTLEAAVEAWKRLWRQGEIGDLTTETTRKNTRKKKKITSRRSKRETIRAYQQRTVLGKNLELKDVEEFGDPLQAKLDDVLRIGLHNLANLSQDGRTSKSRQLIHFILHKSFDIFLMTEIGLCWTKVSNGNQWHERILGKFRSCRSVFAYNKTELQRSKALQPGGVGIIATDEVTHRVTAQGKGTQQALADGLG
jgi:hypothetical protein